MRQEYPDGSGGVNVVYGRPSWAHSAHSAFTLNLTNAVRSCGRCKVERLRYNGGRGRTTQPE